MKDKRSIILAETLEALRPSNPTITGNHGIAIARVLEVGLREFEVVVKRADSWLSNCEARGAIHELPPFQEIEAQVSAKLNAVFDTDDKD